jgi:predicted Zn-dependent protease with MMP-like domain
VTPAAFEDLVERALEELPEQLRDHMDNVIVVVEDEPGPEDGDVLGIYRGVDLTRRDDSYVFALPDEIVIFQGPIERLCEGEDELVEQVRVTVLHEVAHHFGISDDRLAELGWD